MWGTVVNISELKEHARKVVEILEGHLPDGTKSPLDWDSPLQLLVATILAAQSKDDTINTITPVLFGKYPTALAIATAPADDIEEIIKKSGFFRNKAKAVQACCRTIADDYSGEVPRTMDALTALPGVGRKTANVVLANAFGLPGVIVDTHVRRVSQRLGLTANDDPERIESDLALLISESQWSDFSHRVTWFGRTTCLARKPDCENCPLAGICPSGTR